MKRPPLGEWTRTLITVVVTLLGVGVAAFTVIWTVNQQIDEQRTSQAERFRVGVFKDYLQLMTDFRLDESFRVPTLPPSAEAVETGAEAEFKVDVQSLIYEHTKLALAQLDLNQKATVVKFLSRTGWTSNDSTLFPIEPFNFPPRRAILQDAELNNIDLRGLWSPKINLHGAKLENINLSKARIEQSDLSNTELIRANLSEATLSGASLCGANLSGANLSDADLRGAGLFGTNLTNADLTNANLTGAYLRSPVENVAIPAEARAFCGILARIDYPRLTNLTSAIVTNEQLAQVADLVGVTMPNRFKMTEKCWEDFKESRFQCASP